jgi:alkylation response protein AidB-like acyl-CoA dehydrogenase
MEFGLSDRQRQWQSAAARLGSGIGAAPVPEVIRRAAEAGLVESTPDLLAASAAIEALAFESAGAAIALALHVGVAAGLDGERRFARLARGEIVGAIALSSDEVPQEIDGRVSGRAVWVAPLTAGGVAIVGLRGAAGLTAVAVDLGDEGVVQEALDTAALGGLVCGHLRLSGVPYVPVGATMPFMARVRILLAAAGLGMGRRALREALDAARGHTGHGAGGEQTVQGLLADAATELDAAMLLTWKAAAASTLSLADASIAKLAATDATQRAVARATQVVGARSFERGHIIERLAQDVRALELFAGRTEALREAVATELLPPTADRRP